MKKRLISLFMVLTLTVSLLPAASLAAAKKMEENVPVWTEESVKDYALKYIKGVDLETLRGYYDLQIRRYMPMETYQVMLQEIEWMTGAFVQLGDYTSFEEPTRKTKTHVLHLCMEKLDLDMYFTHKNQADDWEIMAIEFVPAEKQIALGSQGTQAKAEDTAMEPGYVEKEVLVGQAPYELNGILTLPEGASEATPVPACVLVHGSGPLDMDETVGQTKFFADLAHAFARKGIATLRYDKRTYAYGSAMTEEEIRNITVKEETILDAILAGRLLQDSKGVDPEKIVLVGHSLGAMLAPRIASEADGMFCAMLLIAGTPKTLLEVMISQNSAEIDKLGEAERAAFEDAIMSLVNELAKMKEEDARELTIFGLNAYYFWEMEQEDAIQLVKKLKLPAYIVQGSSDFQIPVEDGVELYEDKLGEGAAFIDYKVFRGLNHLLMRYTGDAAYQNSIQEYDTPANVDAMAADDMAVWIQGLWKTDEEE